LVIINCEQKDTADSIDVVGWFEISKGIADIPVLEATKKYADCSR
jgi:hypothetical protein